MKKQVSVLKCRVLSVLSGATQDAETTSFELFDSRYLKKPPLLLPSKGLYKH